MSLVERLPNPVAEARQQLDQMRPQFEAALPAHIPAERFARVVMTAIQNNPNLITKCSRQSLWNACMKAAQDGLLPDGREGAIVEYGTAAQWMPMIAGIRKKVRNSGEIATWDVYIVHKNDRFEFRLGDDPFVAHVPTLEDPGPVIAAYSIAVLKTGEKSREVMSVSAINKIRERSKAKGSGPWVTDFEEMARKTVARRHSKVLPMSTDLDDLLRRDDALYDLDGARTEAQNNRPKSLSGRLDVLAQIAGPAAEQDAAAKAPQEEAQDEASDALEVDDVTQAQASQEPQEPQDEASYKAYAEAHIAAATNADLLQSWYAGDQQRKLRNDCGVLKPVFDALQAAVKARVTTLRAQKR